MDQKNRTRVGLFCTQARVFAASFLIIGSTNNAQSSPMLLTDVEVVMEDASDNYYSFG